mmetsp:Transcript_6196/g.6852  ORF Transcript_6196/g.6852 Transcript_6196/m.6852 type:complete len:287 (-) Transcript_6196:92-952(-)
MVDTFPIFCSKGEYNPHYNGKIRKVFVAATIRGLIEDVYGGIKGTTYDSNTLDKWTPSPIAHQEYLGDNHFHHPRIIRSGTVAEVAALPVSERAAAVRRMESVSFIRARIEQIFSPSGLRRFKRLKHWGAMDASLQKHLVVVLAAAYNFDVIIHKGTKLRFMPMTKDWMDHYKAHMSDSCTDAKTKVRERVKRVEMKRKLRETTLKKAARKQAAPRVKHEVASRVEASLLAREAQYARVKQLLNRHAVNPAPPVLPRTCTCKVGKTGRAAAGRHKKTCPMAPNCKK